MKTIMRTRWSRLALVFLALGLTSCDGVLTPTTLEFDRAFTYAFDSSAGLTRTATLTQADILGQVEIPEGASIEAVDIQSLTLSLDASPLNTATSANIAFSYLGITIASIAAVPAVDGDSISIPASSVGTLRTNAEAMLRGAAGAPSQITITSTVSGIVPSGARLVVNAELKVKLTLTYLTCENLGAGPIGPTGDCDFIEP